jgi:hypothetical protein
MKKFISTVLMSFICAACAMGTEDGPPGSEPSGAKSGALAVPQAGRAPSRPGQVPTVPPGLEAHWQKALAAWKSAAQEFIRSCGVHPRGDLPTLRLEVAFVPLPGAQAEGQQVLIPDWILVPPHELQRLEQDMAPERLQGCLESVRGLPLKVPLSGARLAPGSPPLVESVFIHL